VNWWLFLQLIILIVVLALCVGAAAENFVDNLYKRRQENEAASDERQGRTVFRGRSDT
jgi:hypothetical protein